MHCRELTPFGLEITYAQPRQCITSVSSDEVRQWLDAHRLLVFRGYSMPDDEQMLAFCARLGEILQWQFGAVNELRVDTDTENYLYTNRAVPFHWDGAFAGRVPHIIFFHCVQAPPAEHGGETLFCDSARLLASLDDDERETLQQMRITYSTDKIAHYGGQFTSPLLATHPLTRERVLRFAEPVDDLNPVRLEIEGLPAQAHELFLRRMQELLRDERWCLAHAWQTGDVVVADNHVLLHGRRAFAQAAPRHLRRVNIL